MLGLLIYTPLLEDSTHKYYYSIANATIIDWFNLTFRFTYYIACTSCEHYKSINHDNRKCRTKMVIRMVCRGYINDQRNGSWISCGFIKILLPLAVASTTIVTCPAIVNVNEVHSALFIAYSEPHGSRTTINI